MTRTVLLALSGLLFAGAPALADGGFMPPMDYSGADLAEPGQRAVLIHQKGREVLFLFVDYHGDAGTFAWIVPTPSRVQPRRQHRRGPGETGRLP